MDVIKPNLNNVQSINVCRNKCLIFPDPDNFAINGKNAAIYR